MERTVLKYAPSYWDKNIEDLSCQHNLRRSSEEFQIIEHQIKQATRNSSLRIKSIQRNQNIYDYGQVLIREQLLATAKSNQNYYRVRRYIKIRRQYLSRALEYNIDHRRCGMAHLTFENHISAPDFNEVILVVQVITNTPNAESIAPGNSSDYFIDYIVDTE